MDLKNIILVEDSKFNLSNENVYFEDIAHIFSLNHCYWTTLSLISSDGIAIFFSNFVRSYESSYPLY